MLGRSYACWQKYQRFKAHTLAAFGGIEDSIGARVLGYPTAPDAAGKLVRGRRPDQPRGAMTGARPRLAARRAAARPGRPRAGGAQRLSVLRGRCAAGARRRAGGSRACCGLTPAGAGPAAAGVGHYVAWFEVGEVDAARLAEAVAAALPGHEWLWYINPPAARSVPGINHAQVFARLPPA